MTNPWHEFMKPKNRLMSSRPIPNRLITRIILSFISHFRSTGVLKSIYWILHLHRITILNSKPCLLASKNPISHLHCFTSEEIAIKTEKKFQIQYAWLLEIIIPSKFLSCSFQHDILDWQQNLRCSGQNFVRLLHSPPYSLIF